MPPSAVYFWGVLRKSTISITSTFASSKPATSENVIFTFVPLSNNVALDLPILKIPPAPPPEAPPPIFLINKIMAPTMMMIEINEVLKGPKNSGSVITIIIGAATLFSLQ